MLLLGVVKFMAKKTSVPSNRSMYLLHPCPTMLVSSYRPGKMNMLAIAWIMPVSVDLCVFVLVISIGFILTLTLSLVSAVKESSTLFLPFLTILLTKLG